MMSGVSSQKTGPLTVTRALEFDNFIDHDALCFDADTWSPSELDVFGLFL